MTLSKQIPDTGQVLRVETSPYATVQSLCYSTALSFKHLQVLGVSIGKVIF